MLKCDLGKNIKGILIIDTDGRILTNVQLSQDNNPIYQYPVLTAESFRQLGMTETEPFDILKVTVADGKVDDASIITGIQPVLKNPPQNFNIEFTAVTNENSYAHILNMWSEYLRSDIKPPICF